MDAQISYNPLLPVCVNVEEKIKTNEFSVFRKNLVIPFLLLFAFCAAAGFVYADINGGVSELYRAIADKAGKCTPAEAIRGCIIAVSAFILPIALAGMTVFGRIASVSAYSALSFCIGAATSCVTAVYSERILQRFLLFALICSAFAFFDLLFCCGVFVFSKRAFAGKNELFRLRPLLSYSVFFLMVFSINLVLTYIYVLFVKS
ncbi:MAG: hypothetical protein IJQ53_04405 [Clostridia bacterium]|nr:hypothetical protein [Clostridia bacterium]